MSEIVTVEHQAELVEESDQDRLARLTPLLMAPFADDLVGYKPTVWCTACTANKKDKHCDRHKRIKCDVCKALISEAHTDLSYVGHAVVTTRLLAVDPAWNWEPMGYAQDGTPATSNGGMWIRLTIGGVTRIGYGDGGPGHNGIKEMIGDAIRNAAYRFGVATYLWGGRQQQAMQEAAAQAVVDGPSAEELAAELNDVKVRQRIEWATTVDQLRALWGMTTSDELHGLITAKSATLSEQTPAERQDAAVHAASFPDDASSAPETESPQTRTITRRGAPPS